MKKKLFSLFLALVICGGGLPHFSVSAEEQEHEHYLCGGDTCTEVGGHSEDEKTTFTAWDDTLAESQNGSGKTAANSLPKTAGSYYLTKNVELDSQWNVESVEITLCLNGYSITCNADKGAVNIAAEERGHDVAPAGTLNLTDCNGSGQGNGKITHGTNESTGEKYNGIGVGISSACTLNMYGGSITGNEKDDIGGGVYNVGYFNMYGGSITNNKVTGTGAGQGLGGGVYNRGTFIMYNGAITGNSAAKNGGGVYYNNGTMTLGGTVTIKDNKKNTSENNVYLPSGKTITIGTSGITGSSVGITGEADSTVVTGSTSTTIFTSDDSTTYELEAVDGNLKLVTKSSQDEDSEHEGYKAWTNALAISQNGTGKTAANSLPTTAGKYYLTEDVELTSTWEVDADITLCLHGHLILAKSGTASDNLIKVNSSGSLTIEKCKDYSGNIHGYSNISGNSCLIYNNGGALKISCFRKLEMKASKTGNCYGIKNGGKLDIDGNVRITVTADGTGSNAYGIYYCAPPEGSAAKPIVTLGGNDMELFAESNNSADGAYGIYSNGVDGTAKVKGHSSVTATGDGDTYGIYAVGATANGFTVNAESLDGIGRPNLSPAKLPTYGIYAGQNSKVTVDTSSHKTAVTGQTCGIKAAGGKVIIGGGALVEGFDEVGIDAASGSSVTITDGDIRGGVSPDVTSTKGTGIKANGVDINISGNPKITGKTCDIDISKGNKINITGEMAWSSGSGPVSVSYPVADETFTSGWSTYGSDINYLSYFKSANNSWEVWLDSTTGELQMSETSHEHYLCGGDACNGVGSHSEATKTAFTRWTNTTSLPADEGKYYLTKDVTLTGGWTVGANITLCLNGHNIILNGNGTAINIDAGKTLTLTDCKGTGKITHGTNYTGGGVYIQGASISGGILNMYGGNITGNKVSTGDADAQGSVYIGPYAIFNMYGGKITDNTTEQTGSNILYGAYGGGVYNDDGSFNMFGGEISGNTVSAADTSAYGGGVYNNRGSFYIKDGKIYGNMAKTAGSDGKAYGGGVYSERCIVTILGGEISGNTVVSTGSGGKAYGGGVYNDIGSDKGSFKVGGNVKIIDNMSGTTLKDMSGNYINGTESNVYVNSENNRMVIDAALTDSAMIGVYADNDITVFAQAASNTDLSGDDNFYKKIFSSDKEGYVAQKNDNNTLSLVEGKGTYRGTVKMKTVYLLTSAIAQSGDINVEDFFADGSVPAGAKITNIQAQDVTFGSRWKASIDLMFGEFKWSKGAEAMTVADGSTYSRKVTISSTNYSDIYTQIVFVAKDKLSQAPLTITGGDTVVYGDTLQLGTSGGSTDGDVDWSVEYDTTSAGNATIDGNGLLTTLNVGRVTVKATMAGDETYESVTDTKEITITERPVTIKALDKTAYVGDAAPDLTDTVYGTDYTVEGVSSDSVSDVKMYYMHDEGYFITPDMSKVGKTHIAIFDGKIGGKAFAESTNYDVTVETGYLNVIERPSESKGGGTGKKPTTVSINGETKSDSTLPVIGEQDDVRPETEKPNTEKPADDRRYNVCGRGNDCLLAVFPDVDPMAWYHDGVHYCVENGLMKGYDNGYFGTDDSIFRGQVVTILWRLEGSPAASGNGFSDVAEGAYYETAVAWATANGIMEGYGDGRFAPDFPITREQLAAVLYRYAQYKGMDVSIGEDTNILDYDDAFDISPYAVSAIQWACGSGVMGGTGLYTLEPQGTATRAQAACMMQRFLTGSK